MADNDIPQYPFMFSADQFANKYSPFSSGIQVPGWPTQYYVPPVSAGGPGAPTDALGRPIQSYLDTQAKHDAWAPAPTMAPAKTLNSSPLDAPAWSELNRLGSSGDPGVDAMLAQRAAPLGNPVMGMTGSGPGSNTGIVGWSMGPMGQGRRQAAPQAAAPQNPYDMNQAYLTALSNPGKVVTGGATVPQAPQPTGQSGVLQQFLANWQNKGSPTTGAGNYNNAGFFNALRG